MFFESIFRTMNTPFEGQNYGNIKLISLIAFDNLLSIPEPFNGEISYDGLSIKEGSSFQEIYFTPETGVFTEQSEDTKAGLVWNKEINLEIPKIRSEITSGLKNFENRKLAALVTDENNTSFIVFPLRMNQKKQIPGQITSKNAILLNLTGKSVSESPVIIDLP